MEKIGQGTGIQREISFLAGKTAVNKRKHLDEMVQEVNATQVEPIDRLIDHAIIVNF
jgi:hypothetical protein